MKNQITLTLVALTLDLGLVSTAPAQNAWQAASKTHSQPAAELSGWAQSQKPDPVPSPKPVPLPDQQPEQQPAPEQPPAAPPDQAQKSATRTFSGTITKTGKKYVLKTSDKATYDLDDQARAKKYEGKQVEVVGTLESGSHMIHVEDMKEAA